MAYVTLEEFRTRSTMLVEDVDWLEGHAPGFLEATLNKYSARLDARLRKRYAVPFGNPIPDIIKSWIIDQTTVDAYYKRGWDPSATQNAALIERAKQAEAEAIEAADSEKGAFDLPLADTGDESAVTKGGPMGYSETSPYRSFDLERQSAYDEDGSRSTSNDVLRSRYG